MILYDNYKNTKMINTGNNLLTGIKDLDREIVNKLSDRDLLQICSLNKTYSQRVCDDSYFRLRTEKGFPETIQYKDSVNPQRTWKNHYLNIVNYVDLLQEKYKYEYKKLDKSPELLYLARRLVHHYIYNKNRALIYASIHGKLPIVKYLVEQGANVNHNNDLSLVYASENGHLTVVKYLVEHCANIHANNNESLRFAILKGHLSVVKYLVENGADLKSIDSKTIRYAQEYKYLDIVEYLNSLK